LIAVFSVALKHGFYRLSLLQSPGGNRHPAYGFEYLILSAGHRADEIHFGANGSKMTPEDIKRHGYLCMSLYFNEFLGTIFTDSSWYISKLLRPMHRIRTGETDRKNETKNKVSSCVL
jgi:hypothetical protein